MPMLPAINVRLNSVLIASAALVNLHQFVLLPAVLLPMSRLWLITLLPCALLSNSLWYLMHEAFHRNLHPDLRVNEAAGRTLSVLFGAPYHVVRFGHLMHHRFNGAPVDRPDLYDARTTTRAASALRYYWGLFAGLYLSELLTCLLFLLPKALLGRLIGRLAASGDAASREITAFARKQLLNDTVLRSIRIDGLAACAVIAATVVLYGPAWPAILFILLARAFFISFANNLPHYGTSPDDVRYGLNIRLPRPLASLLLNFNYHRVHHHDPLLPWTALPPAFRSSGDSFDAPLFDAAIAQFRGPIPRDRRSR